MQVFRDLVKGWLGKGILILVALMFVLLGTETLLSVFNKPKPVAEVNGEEISEGEIARQVELQKRSIMARMGENANPDLIDAAKLRPQAIETLVQRYVMRQASEEDGLIAAHQNILQLITELPQFQQDGQFSEELFERRVLSMGYRPSQFLSEISADFVTTQFRNGVSLSAFITDSELKHLVALQNQKRDIAYVKISRDSFKDSIQVSDEQIKEYYEKNSERYKTPEMAKVAYVELSANQFVDEVEVTDEQIKTEYELEKQRAQENEERKSSHILVEMNDDRSEEDALKLIKEVKSKLDNGDDFAALAKEYSDDSGSKESGGDIGYSARGDLTEPFENVLFALQEGEISEPVKTEYGYHIIKLDDVKQDEVAPLEDMKDVIAKRLKEKLAEDLLYEKQIDFETDIFEGGDLSAAAEDFGLEVKTSDWLKRSGNAGIFRNGELVNAIFDTPVLLDGRNSPVIEVEKGKLVAARLLEHKPERIKDLSEVKADIEMTLAKEESQKAANKKGRDIIAKIRGGESTEDAIEGLGEEWTVVAEAERRSPDLDFAIGQKAFKMPKPTEDKKSVDGVETADGFAVVVVSKVEPGQFDLSENEIKQMKQFLANQLGQMDYLNYVNYKKSKAKIEKRNQS